MLGFGTVCGYNAMTNAIFVPPMTSVPLCQPASRLLCAVLAAVLVVASPMVLAERADRLAPMNIEADMLRHDDANQISVFTGNVIVTKGSIVLRGQELQVRQDAQGHQRSVVIGSPAQRAFFRQKREGLDEFVEAEALRIDYDSLSDTVTLTGQAVLRRLRGTVLSDETQGSRIVYNGTLETFTVEGGAAGRTADNPTGRVRALLTPTPAPVTTPVTPTPVPALTPSDRLELRP